MRFRRSSGFHGSQQYWNQRYEQGGTSGQGSYGEFAEYKAGLVNSFVKENEIRSVVEFGCGDGNQLSLAEYGHYVGLDVSQKAIDLCRDRFAGDQTKEFFLYRAGDPLPPSWSADMALSLDVVYHLVEDSTFETYMGDLFAAARRFVVIYTTNDEQWETDPWPFVRHRAVAKWIDGHVHDWTLHRCVPSPDRTRFLDFLVYRPRDPSG